MGVAEPQAAWQAADLPRFWDKTGYQKKLFWQVSWAYPRISHLQCSDTHSLPLPFGSRILYFTLDQFVPSCCLPVAPFKYLCFIRESAVLLLPWLSMWHTAPHHIFGQEDVLVKVATQMKSSLKLLV